MDEGPFFHGTKADLRDGDLLSAGFRSNYRPEVVMNHIYFTAFRTVRDSLRNSQPVTAPPGFTPSSRPGPSRMTQT